MAAYTYNILLLGLIFCTHLPRRKKKEAKAILIKLASYFANRCAAATFLSVTEIFYIPRGISQFS